jgi:hypothetical protein
MHHGLGCKIRMRSGQAVRGAEGEMAKMERLQRD